MLSHRAPIFSVSLAFALGCLLGLDGWIALRVALAVWVVAGLLWFFLGRHEKTSLAVFYIFTACAGLVYTLLVGSTVASNDLRRLSDEKTLETTQWRGLIIEEPTAQMSSRITRRTLDRTAFVLRVEAWRPTEGRLFGSEIDAPWQPAQGDIQCILIGPAKELKCGDRLEFANALMPVESPPCPGQLDYRAWEAGQGIYYHAVIPASAWKRIETGGGNWGQNLSFQARDWAYGRLQIGLEDDPRMADFLAGMLIGYRQQIPTDIEQDFRRTGTLHVFAVSGQNIAEMVVVALVLLQLCGLVRWRWAWTLAPVVLLYCLLTGSPASAIRATVMALTVLLAWRLGRPLNALSCWSLAFLAMSICNPVMLLNPGAQLSFGVVLGLILIAPPITRFLVRPFARDPFLPRQLMTTAQRNEEWCWWILCGLLGAGVAAAMVSEPITAFDFHQITPISVLANLVVVPVAGLITMIGTLSVTVSLVSTPLAALLNNANWLFARLLIMFVGFLAHQPGAAINVPDVRAFSSPIPSFVVAPLQDSAGLLVRTSSQAWLINAGRENVATSTTEHLLQFYGINRLEGLVLAQMSAPDNGGAAILVRDFHPRQLVVPVLSSRSPLEKTMPDTIALAGGKLESWQRGQSIDLGSGVTVEILHPAANSTESHAEDRALVLLFHVGDRTLLWAGKIGPQAQAEILAAYPGLRADVLIMDAEPPPNRTWLQALQVRYWLQIPARDARVNSTFTPMVADDLCRVWPLDKTGAVDIHFQPGKNNWPDGIRLNPWLELPSEH